MLGRRTNTIPTFGQHLVFAGTYPQANTREDICSRSPTTYNNNNN